MLRSTYNVNDGVYDTATKCALDCKKVTKPKQFYDRFTLILMMKW